jgi:hypothetical protein
MNTVTSYTLFSNLCIAASGSATSFPVWLSDSVRNCSLFLQSHDAVPTAATGTISVVHELSHDKINWSQDGSDLLTGFTKTSGASADGKTFLDFFPPVTTWLRLKVTETGAVSAAYITIILGVT